MTELLEFTGPKGIVLLFLGGAGGLVAVASLVLATFTWTFRPALAMAGISIGFGGVAFLLGLSWRSLDRYETLGALGHVAAADRPMVLEAVLRESEANVTLGAMMAIPLVLIACGTIGASFARTRASR